MNRREGTKKGWKQIQEEDRGYQGEKRRGTTRRKEREDCSGDRKIEGQEQRKKRRRTVGTEERNKEEG